MASSPGPKRPQKPDFSLEREYGGLVCGVDEAGRGPLAGPVVAAAVIFPTRRAPAGINDSKKLTREMREALFSAILRRAHTGIGLASVEEIDRLNILGATLLAMRRAVAALPHAPAVALVDGNRPPPLSCPVSCVVKGDARSLSIASASILAKVTRDRIMGELAKDYPHYGFDRHAGYPTPCHREALRIHGVTPHHRRSFAPVRAALCGIGEE